LILCGDRAKSCLELQIILDVPDEELQRRCKQDEQSDEALVNDGQSEMLRPDAHHNTADQARRLAAYKDLRAQDEADREFQVWRCTWGCAVHRFRTGFSTHILMLYTLKCRLQCLIAKARWHQALERAEMKKKKAAEAEQYRRTHQKRARSPNQDSDNKQCTDPSAAQGPVGDTAKEGTAAEPLVGESVDTLGEQNTEQQVSHAAFISITSELAISATYPSSADIFVGPRDAQKGWFCCLLRAVSCCCRGAVFHCA
jgi:hypothetical protein